MRTIVTFQRTPALVIGATVTALVIGGVGALQAQTGRPAAAPSAVNPTPLKVAADVPRASSGKPDLSGVWDFGSLTPLERPKEFGERAYLTKDEVAAIEKQAADNAFVDRPPPAGDPGAYNRFWTDVGSRVVEGARNSLVIDPPDGRILEMTPAAKARDDERWAKRQAAARAQDLPSWDRCLTGFNAGQPILPSGYNNNVQIFQTHETLALLTEMVHDARIIPIGNRPPLPSTIRQWHGDSRGRWDGDTFVIETRNFSNHGTGTLVLDRQFSPRPGLGGTPDENLVLTERLTRVNRETLIYQFTVDDPAVWTRPWTVEMTMRRGEALYEYACHEGNYGLANILSAARAEEKKGATPRNEGR
ncbi:MAG: hypothetical protein FJW27_15060 [Acidimicrobiia bacterium]|nr:hypothetical protein [Acidimicrobiia bacterium]